MAPAGLDLPTLSDKEIFQLLYQHVNNKEDVVGPEWMTFVAIKKAQSKSDTQLRIALRRMVEEGLVERKSFRVRSPEGTVRALPHYRFVRLAK